MVPYIRNMCNCGSCFFQFVSGNDNPICCEGEELCLSLDNFSFMMSILNE